ncbi:hypothetical protein, partial [Salmonella sp. ZJHZ20_0162]|uniref:hypothetical protein n=1 Tax=Salmonella sp. ZJHZ20_0162 TaxID=3159595 RepID=UPI00397C353A
MSVFISVLLTQMISSSGSHGAFWFLRAIFSAYVTISNEYIAYFSKNLGEKAKFLLSYVILTYKIRIDMDVKQQVAQQRVELEAAVAKALD